MRGFFIGNLSYGDATNKKRWQIAMLMHGASLILLFFVRTDLAVGLFGLLIAKALFFVAGFGVISLLPFSLGSLVFTMGYKHSVGSALYDRLLRGRLADKGLETFLVWPEVRQLYRYEKPDRDL